MPENITVFVHHEIYDSKTKNYWLDCLIQAKKYNTKVVLCGTKIQESMVTGICDFVEADKLIDEKWDEFKKYFKNYTISYCDNYQLAIHKRLFMLSNYMAMHNLNEVILIDSDVLSYPIYTLLNGTEVKGYNIHLAGNSKKWILECL